MTACTHTIILVLVLAFPSLFAAPIKRRVIDPDCYGTNCEWDPDYQEDIEINFPDNLTQTIMSVLPSIEGSQVKIVSLLNQTLTTSEHQNEDVEAFHRETVALLKHHSDQIQNLTSIMTDLFGDIAALLHDQLSVPHVGPAPMFKDTPNLETTEAVNQPTSAQPTSQIATNTSLPTDCQDAAARGFSKSGSYTISPPDGLGSFQAYCDMDTDGGGWTVFQKRFDGSVDFNRVWNEYDQGFGDPSTGEYWLGLRNIHRIVSQPDTTWKLRVDMEAYDTHTAYAVYNAFMIDDADSNYRLTVGSYTGNAGDSIRGTGDGSSNNMPFSTPDRDNDNSDYTDYCVGGGLTGAFMLI